VLHHTIPRMSDKTHQVVARGEPHRGRETETVSGDSNAHRIAGRVAWPLSQVSSRVTPTIGGSLPSVTGSRRIDPVRVAETASGDTGRGSAERHRMPRMSWHRTYLRRPADVRVGLCEAHLQPRWIVQRAVDLDSPGGFVLTNRAGQDDWGMMTGLKTGRPLSPADHHRNYMYM